MAYYAYSASGCKSKDGSIYSDIENRILRARLESIGCADRKPAGVLEYWSIGVLDEIQIDVNESHIKQSRAIIFDRELGVFN